MIVQSLRSSALLDMTNDPLPFESEHCHGNATTLDLELQYRFQGSITCNDISLILVEIILHWLGG